MEWLGYVATSLEIIKNISQKWVRIIKSIKTLTNLRVNLTPMVFNEWDKKSELFCILLAHIINETLIF